MTQKSGRTQIGDQGMAWYWWQANMISTRHEVGGLAWWFRAATAWQMN